MSTDGLRAATDKMREAGVSELAVSVFSRFHEQLREEIVQVHLRVYRRQRVLPGRGQHLEKSAMALIIPVGIAGCP